MNTYQNQSKMNKVPSSPPTNYLLIFSLLCAVALFLAVTYISLTTLGLKQLERTLPIDNNIAKITYDENKYKNNSGLDSFKRTGNFNVNNNNHDIPLVELAEERIQSSLPTIPFHNLNCPHGELLTFWQHETNEDKAYKTPYENTESSIKYVTFEPGNNNVFSFNFQI